MTLTMSYIDLEFIFALLLLVNKSLKSIGCCTLHTWLYHYFIFDWIHPNIFINGVHVFYLLQLTNRFQMGKELITFDSFVTPTMYVGKYIQLLLPIHEVGCQNIQ